MATIRDALKQGLLCEYRLPDWELRDPIRCLYYHPDFFDGWLDINAPMNDPKSGKNYKTRAEHLEQQFCEWRCSHRPSGTELRRVMPVEKGVVKLHPFKSRVYGWFTKSGEFVAMSGATEEATKLDKKLTDRRRTEILKFLRDHKLEGELLQGEISEIIKAARR